MPDRILAMTGEEDRMNDQDQEATDFPVNGAADAFPEAEREAVYRAIYQRRDIRNFRTDPIPDHVLARIIRAAHHGPSVGFMQPWDFIIVRDTERRQRVKDLFDREREAAACFFDEPRRSAYLSLKLEGILESPVNVCITCDPTRADVVLGTQFDAGNGRLFHLLRRAEPVVGGAQRGCWRGLGEHPQAAPTARYSGDPAAYHSGGVSLPGLSG